MNASARAAHRRFGSLCSSSNTIAAIRSKKNFTRTWKMFRGIAPGRVESIASQNNVVTATVLLRRRVMVCAFHRLHSALVDYGVVQLVLTAL